MHRCCLATVLVMGAAARGGVLFSEEFEDGDLAARGWYDVAKWGEERSLSIADAPEVRARTGARCLKIRYAKGDTGGWMHVRFKGVPEVFVRYYRLFPEGWEWPQGYGPHDSIVFAGSYGGAANRTPFNVDPPDKVKPGEWHCVEYRARLSDPGRENGRLTLWVNGKLVSDLPGLPLVDEKHAGILFDHWMLGPYFHGGSHREQHNYLDCLVISTDYIGTIEQKGDQPPRAWFATARAWGSMTAEFDASRGADPDGQVRLFSWEFGDGSSGLGEKVSHTYGGEGEYTVTLTATDGGGQAHSFRRTVTMGKTIGSGGGLKAEYFDGEGLEGRAAIEVAGPIAFRRRGWDGRYLSSRRGDENGDHFSCRWTGFLQPTASEEYTLIYEVNDGGRLWFDGRLVIDAWDRAQVKPASVGKLAGGRKYPIRIEHWKGTFESTRDWKALLYWESPSTPREIVPATQLYPPEGLEERLGSGAAGS